MFGNNKRHKVDLFTAMTDVQESVGEKKHNIDETMEVIKHHALKLNPWFHLGKTDREEILKFVLRDIHHNPDIDKAKAIAVIDAVLNAEPNEVERIAPTSKLGFSFGIGDDWAKPYNWLLQNWIPSGEVGFIAGASGAGKSFAALEIMGSVAFDIPAFNQVKASRNGIVMYCTVEGVNGVKKRIKAYTDKHNVDPSLLNNKIMVSNESFTFKNTKAVSFAEHVKAVETFSDDKVELIIFDTFILYGGCSSENSSDEVSIAINWMKELARETGTTVMAIHHSGKGSSDNPIVVGSDKNQILRGSSDFGASAEFVLGVCNSPIEESDDIENAVWIAKLKDAKTPEPLGFEIINHKLQLQDDIVEDVGVVNVNGSMTPIPPAKKRENEPKPYELDLEVLREILPVESNKKSVRKAFIDKLVNGGLTPKTAANRFTEIKKKAIKDGVMVEEDSAYKLK